MKIGKVLNKSTLMVEAATVKTCPRCRGNGSVSGNGTCYLCKGAGRTWLSVNNTGWAKPLYSRSLSDSVIW